MRAICLKSARSTGMGRRTDMYNTSVNLWPTRIMLWKYDHEFVKTAREI